jgi:hypothetical protein
MRSLSHEERQWLGFTALSIALSSSWDFFCPTPAATLTLQGNAFEALKATYESVTLGDWIKKAVFFASLYPVHYFTKRATRPIFASWRNLNALLSRTLQDIAEETGAALYIVDGPNDSYDPAYWR